jgi:hypothetical protein
MQTMRGFLATAVAVAAVLATGCGGGSGGSGGDPLSTASLAPKDAGIWISVDTDQGSNQWRSLDALLAKVPGAEQAIDDPSSSPFAGVPFRSEVLPAIGDRLVLVAVSGRSQGVMLVKPTDPGKLDALLAKTKEHEVTADVEGWTAVAPSSQELAAYQAALAKGTLAGSEAFTSATAGLPHDALAAGYVNGKGLASGLGDLGSLGSVASLPALSGLAAAVPGTSSTFRTTSSSSAAAPGTCTITINGRTEDCSSLTQGGGGGSFVSPSAGLLPGQVASALGSAGFAVTVGDGTVHFEATLETPNGQAPATYEPTLLGKVPSDALVAVSFHGGAALTKQLEASAGGSALKQVEQQLGVSFAELGKALEGEGVLYVRPGAPIPEITLAVTSQDPAATKQVFDTVVAKLGGAASQGLAVPGLAPTTMVSGDVVLVSTSKDPTASFGSGPSLTGTERFKTAAAAVDLGDTTSGFAYVDVHGLAPLLQAALGTLGSMGGGSSSRSDDFSKALSSVDFLAVNSVGETGRVRVEGALKTS